MAVSAGGGGGGLLSMASTVQGLSCEQNDRHTQLKTLTSPLSWWAVITVYMVLTFVFLQDAMRAVTSVAVREARIKEIRTELLNSGKLKVQLMLLK